jgi:DNA-directed RNA polymerase subunit N (RpoN/RPB10)
MKLKRCKGINKAFGFGCAEEKIPFKYGLCSSCYSSWLFNSEAGKSILSKTITKAKSIRNKEKKQSDKRELFELLPYVQRIRKARIVFQKWIRERDIDEPCISCGNAYANKYDAGHYKKAEIYTNIIFDELNVNKQCVYCNQHLSGNELEYRKGLIKKIGIEKVEALESKASKGVYRYTTEELKNIIKKYGN